MKAKDSLDLLLVEDHPINRQLMRALLEVGGHHVDIAEDGEQGVSAAARTRYDMVLMDIRLPGIDGVEATRQIRALGGHNRTVPVIAVTAHVDPKDRASLLANGLDDYLPKPVFPADLFSALDRWAERIKPVAA